jgi:hypothetical protein
MLPRLHCLSLAAALVGQSIVVAGDTARIAGQIAPYRAAVP